MYCLHCEVYFSGSHGGGVCPYCGRAAKPAGTRRGSRERVEEEGGRGRPRTGETTLTEAAEEWVPGTVVAGKYEVVSRLGAGGFGTVYKVRHVHRQKYYALKTPHVEFARDETFRLRFEREIEAMERFVHPDAVMIRDSGVTESGLPYFTMDFITGESLKVVMRREGRLPVDRALRVIRRVLRVLDVAHESQIIHRDIKPDNIMLTVESGRETVKVLDFGVAKLLDLVGDTGSLTRGMRVGTPKYMSPEQVAAQPLDPRSDLFSLGIVFYEMVTGVHPFAEVNDPVRVTAAILNQEPRPIQELAPDVPKAICDHIQWMLEKRVRRRPASAAVLIKQLGAIEEGVSRVTPVPCHRLQLLSSVPRAAAVPLVLRQETSVGERRVFLEFREELTFGRSNDPEKGIRNHFLWRCLPCRSRQLDPENWQRNLTVSQRAGTITIEGTAVVIEPAPHSKYGVSIGGLRSFKPVRIQSDRFHLSLGDRALELDGHRKLRSKEGPWVDLAFLAEGRPAGAEQPRSAGYSNPLCLIDHVHFYRASNWSLHEYFCVYRQALVGSSANVGLRLRGGNVEGVHAAIIHEGGELFLQPLAQRVLVRGSLPGGGGPGEPGVELEPHTLVPLRPGLVVRLGDAELRVEETREGLFKTV